MALSSEVVLAAKEAGSVLIAVAYRRSTEKEFQVDGRMKGDDRSVRRDAVEKNNTS